MFRISFDFNEVTQKVTNIVVESSEGKITRPRTKKKSLDGSKAIVELEANKIILSDAVVDLIDANAENGDRVAINYHQVSNQETFPIIGKSEKFADKQSGNKLTKSNTVSFKGLQNDVLAEYGKLFTVEPFKEGIFKLVPINDVDEIVSADDTVKETLMIEEVELKELNDEEIDIEIQNIVESTYEEDVDDLPF